MKVNWNKKTLFYNGTMIVQNVTHVFKLPSVLEKLWVLNVQISCYLASIFHHNFSFVENGCPLYKCYFRTLQMFSIIDKSELYGGKSESCTPFAAKKDIVVFLTWSLAMSCWNQNLLYLAYNTGRTLSFRNAQYFAMIQ